MINSFQIHNFRTFENLTIDRFGKVNLIVGKNCVGKSTLLEALWLYAARLRPEAIYKFLFDRQEFDVGKGVQNIALLPLLNTELSQSDKSFSLGPINTDNETYVLKICFLQKTSTDHKYIEVSSEQFYSIDANAYPAFKVSLGEVLQYEKLFEGFNKEFPKRQGPLGKSNIVFSFPEWPPFLKISEIEGDMIHLWWNAISLREPEDKVLKFLNLLAPIERISLIQSTLTDFPKTQGLFLARLKGQKEPRSLKSFGDGVERIFRLAVAAEYTRSDRYEPKTWRNATKQKPMDDVIFIDEIDTGIHYSMLPKYWEMIFILAKEMNIQVFATTHSWDCIEGFQIAAQKYDKDEGLLIRLEKKEHKSRAVIFDSKELAIVTRENIEVR